MFPALSFPILWLSPSLYKAPCKLLTRLSVPFCVKLLNTDGKKAVDKTVLLSMGKCSSSVLYVGVGLGPSFPLTGRGKGQGNGRDKWKTVALCFIRPYCL